MEWLLCFLFAICPVQTESDLSPLAQLLIEGQQALDEGWYVFYILDNPPQQNIAFSDPNSAVIYMEHISFESYESESTYFDYDEDMQPYFDTIFERYSPFELQNKCEDGNLAIYEFRGETITQTYNIRIYFERGDGYVQIVGLYLPVEADLDMDGIGARFYPEMPACSDEFAEATPEATEDDD